VGRFVRLARGERRRDDPRALLPHARRLFGLVVAAVLAAD